MLTEAWVEGRVQNPVSEAENWGPESSRSWWKEHLAARIDIAQEAAAGEAALNSEA